MNAANKKLIVIQGPTASGKTALSVSLAKALDTVVFSADSRQFYKELAIGTAKPSLEEQDGVIHYFIDSHFLTDSLTAASYVKQALPLLEKEFKTKEYIVLCGGSGLFIDALCRGLDDVPVNKGVKIEFLEKNTRQRIFTDTLVSRALSRKALMRKLILSINSLGKIFILFNSSKNGENV